MKKIVLFAILLGTAVMFASCGSKEEVATETTTTEVSATETSTDETPVAESVVVDSTAIATETAPVK